jgi:hypothetical protein
MDNLIYHIIPILGLALLTAGWMGVQILARRMNVKNHIDHPEGCCGACANRNTCSNKVETNLTPPH